MPDHRLAELAGGLALANDLASGFPQEKVLRSVVLAVELGKRAGLSNEPLRDAYYASLFRYLGCTGFSHEEAHVYGAGNDLQTRNVMAMADAADPITTVHAIATRIGKGAAPLERARAVSRLLLDRDAVMKHARSQCDTAVKLASLIGASAEVRASLEHVCERWDGLGFPQHARGEQLHVAMRIHHIADVVEIAHHRDGPEAAIAVAKKRAGAHFDPELARIFVRDADELLASISGTSVWDRYLEAEPEPHAMIADASDVARVFALFADLKSVHTVGHSTGVALLARRAGEHAGLSPTGLDELERAALLHDLGRVSVTNAIWDKPAALGHSEWERVRLHAYYTERILARSAAWSPASKLAASAHERVDGTGYHRGLPAPVLARPERILAAADVLHALMEPRPHRPALDLRRATDVLDEECKHGKLDRSAVDAVLAAAGTPRPSRSAWPRGLSDREVEVLRHVARGKSNKEIGTLLGISPRTVQNHVAHVYDKIGVYSRAGASLFVTEHALLEG